METMQRRLDAAASSSAASPSTSVSGVSPIRDTNADTQKGVEHYRLDRMADTPPGLEREMAAVTVRIPGAGDIIIVDQVVDHSIIAQIVPASVDSSQVVSIVDQEAIAEQPSTQSDDIAEEPPIDTVKTSSRSTSRPRSLMRSTRWTSPTTRRTCSASCPCSLLGSRAMLRSRRRRRATRSEEAKPE